MAEFPVYRARVDWLPEELDALLVVSDLQGVEARNAEEDISRLIGHVLAEDLYLLAGSEAMPKAENIGVLLAGDLHVDADLAKPGGKGDVRDVWHTFRSCFRYVAGVAGNHDRFGNTSEEVSDFTDSEGIFYLDGNTRMVESMDVGGVGGIIGNPDKPFRRDEADYLATVREVITQRPTITILHESPAIEEASYKGSPVLRETLEELPPVFLVSGHRGWDYPGLWTLQNGTQILNVEGRALLLCREKRNDSILSLISRGEG